VSGQLAWDLRVLVHACFLRPDDASQTQDVPRIAWFLELLETVVLSAISTIRSTAIRGMGCAVRQRSRRNVGDTHRAMVRSLRLSPRRAKTAVCRNPPSTKCLGNRDASRDQAGTVLGTIAVGPVRVGANRRRETGPRASNQRVSTGLVQGAPKALPPDRGIEAVRNLVQTVYLARHIVRPAML
jgi:hypothetical protein